MRPGAEAWQRHNPKLTAAIRAVWNGTERGEQRELVDHWLRYRITEGLVIGEGSRRMLADVHGRRLGPRHAKELIVGQGIEPAEAFEAREAGPCWFPYCTRGDRHHGQHANITQAGRELVRIRQVAAAMRKAGGELEECQLARLLVDEILG